MSHSVLVTQQPCLTLQCEQNPPQDRHGPPTIVGGFDSQPYVELVPNGSVSPPTYPTYPSSPHPARAARPQSPGICVRSKAPSEWGPGTPFKERNMVGRSFG